MAVTKLEDLVSLKVFAESVQEKMGAKIRLYALSFVQSFDGQQVGSIMVNSYQYGGAAGVVGEGEAVPTKKLSSTSVNLPVIKVADSYMLTDESLRGNFEDPTTKAEEHLSAAIAEGVENKMFEALGTATLTHEVEGQLDGKELLKVKAKFGENQDEEMTLIVNSIHMPEIVSDKAYNDGKFYGVNVLFSDRVDSDEAYLVKEGAVGLYIAQEANVEFDRDSLHQQTLILASQHFATHLREENKAVKITFADSE